MNKFKLTLRVLSTVLILSGSVSAQTNLRLSNATIAGYVENPRGTVVFGSFVDGARIGNSPSVLRTSSSKAGFVLLKSDESRLLRIESSEYIELLACHRLDDRYLVVHGLYRGEFLFSEKSIPSFGLDNFFALVDLESLEVKNVRRIGSDLDDVLLPTVMDGEGNLNVAIPADFELRTNETHNRSSVVRVLSVSRNLEESSLSKTGSSHGPVAWSNSSTLLLRDTLGALFQYDVNTKNTRTLPKRVHPEATIFNSNDVDFVVEKYHNGQKEVCDVKLLAGRTVAEIEAEYVKIQDVFVHANNVFIQGKFSGSLSFSGLATSESDSSNCFVVKVSLTDTSFNLFNLGARNIDQIFIGDADNLHFILNQQLDTNSGYYTNATIREINVENSVLLKELTRSQHTIIVKPNPFSDHIELIAHHNSKISGFELTTLSGDIIIRRELQAPTTVLEIGTESVAPGVYLLRTFGLFGSDTQVLKVLKIE